MESIPGELAKWMLDNGGVWAAVSIIFIGLYLYERYARAKDREAFDAALARSQAEHVETLKLVTPLAQKFTDTMDIILPLAMAHLNSQTARRGE
jgi:hypothetical protein